MILRSWQINGDDGRTYTVHERELPGQQRNPLGGQRRTVRSGLVEYILADGSDLFDEAPGIWETQSGVQLKKPDDL